MVSFFQFGLSISLISELDFNRKYTCHVGLEHHAYVGVASFGIHLNRDDCFNF